MFIKYDDASVRLTGRWNKTKDFAEATAPGSSVELAFSGELAVLHFDMIWNEHPYPHLWISVDGGAKVEAPMSPFLRVEPSAAGTHTVKVIYKGAAEMQHRWYSPLVGKISFKGYEAEKAGVLPENNKKTIEFVGDSITEGVLIDESYKVSPLNHLNRPYQDDVTATYAYLTAKNLNLEPIFMGYGAVGATKSGCSSVPRASDAYPYCYSGAPISHPSADFILINHGANDRAASPQQYLACYQELLDVIIRMNPKSRIISLSAFCGAFNSELEAFITEYNRENQTGILFISSKGWVPAEPLHPLRDGHKIIAGHLTKILKKQFNL